jgi:hypothetical protein
MKKLFSFTIILVFFVVCSSAYPQGGAPGLDAGTVRDSTYTNKYFGMQVHISDGWQVQDNEATRALIERGRDLAVGDDKNLDAMIRASEQRSLTLLSVFKYAPGSPVDFNPSFMCVVERIDGLPGLKKGSDYLFHVRKGLAASKITPTFEREIYDATLAGVEFGVLETKLAVGKLEIRQKYCSTILKGYALSFIVSYSSNEELRVENEMLHSVNLQM